MSPITPRGLAAFILLLGLSLGPVLTARAGVENGQSVDLRFAAVDGRAVDLAQLRGKVVLVDFWATWCPPCRSIAPDIAALYRKYHSQGLEVIGISVDSDKKALLDFIKQEGAPWPQYFNGKGADNPIAAQYGVDSFPTVWLIGRNGKVADADFRQIWVSEQGVARTTSDATKAKLNAAIEKQLKTP